MAWGKPQALEEEEKGGGCVTKVINTAIGQRELAAYARELFKKYPVLTVTGPRQSGKTTLVRACFGKLLPYANLEAPDVRRYALDDPRGFLADFPNGAILDEIQRAPELASYIQVIVDDRGDNGVFVLTGSHQFELHESVSQSLAGRTAILRLLPLTIRELSKLTSDLEVDEMLVGGFMPRIYDQSIPHTQALSDYVATYVERDLRQLVAIRNLDTFERFLGVMRGTRWATSQPLEPWQRCGGLSYNGARVGQPASGKHILFTLPPYYRNVGKRLIKSPKLYFHDVGLAAHLAGINSPGQMKTHPSLGGFFENLVVGEALKWQTNRGMKPSLHFFRDSSGNEVDLFFQESGHFLPVEIKSGQTVVRDFFKGLNAFHRIYRWAACPCMAGNSAESNEKLPSQRRATSLRTSENSSKGARGNCTREATRLPMIRDLGHLHFEVKK